MALVSGLDHLTIHTSRPGETIAFYESVLGLEDRPDQRPDFDFPGAWLWLGSQAVVHLVFEDDDPGLQTDAPFNHIAFASHDFDQIVAQLDELGLEHRISDRPNIGLKQIFVRDPNGVRVEINCRQPG